MKISVDLDGVLASFSAGVVRAANKLWPGKLPEGFDPPDWNYTGIFTSDDWSRVWAEIKATENFWLSLPAIQHEVAALRFFLKRTSGFDIFYCTSRVPSAGLTVMRQCQEWLWNQDLIASRNAVSIISVSGAEHKKAVMQAVGIEYSLDDCDQTVKQCLFNGHQAYLLRRPWNATSDFPWVVESVREYLDIVHQAAYGVPLFATEATTNGLTSSK